MTPEQLDEIEKLYAAATPGPWSQEVWQGNDDTGGWAAVGPHQESTDCICESEEDRENCNGEYCADERSQNDEEQAWKDAVFIRAMRQHALPLIKALREAWAEVTQMSIRLRNAEQEIHAERQCALSAKAEHIRERDRLYTERNRLVALAAKMAERDGFDAGVREHKGDVEPGWSTVVVIDLPAGQVSWHLPDAEADAFTAALPEYLGSWDGHTTDEKHARIEAFLKEEP